MTTWNKTIAVGLTGASGVHYGLRVLRGLVEADTRVYLLVSQAAQVVLKMEAGLEVPSRPAEAKRFFSDYLGAAPGQLRVFGRQEWTAPVASGTSPPDAMVVCPCTTGTLASIAAGLSQDLMDRAADVALKERRPLVLVPRETPLSSIHLRRLLEASEAGASIVPAMPAFYHRPVTLQDAVDHVVGKVLTTLGLEQTLFPPWDGG